MNAALIKAVRTDQSQKEKAAKNLVFSGVKLSGNSDKKARVQEDAEEFERVLGNIEGSVMIKKLRRITTKKQIGNGSTNKPISVIVEFESNEIRDKVLRSSDKLRNNEHNKEFDNVFIRPD